MNGGLAMRMIVRLSLFALAAVMGPLGVLHACSRHADLRDDEVPQQTLDPTPEVDADLPVLDADLSPDAQPVCEERPQQGDCVGSNDFLCAFSGWATEIAKQCQLDTGCKTNGSIELTMGANGCVTSIGMDEPNDEMVTCVLAQVTPYRCPCIEEETILYYFGVGNDGDCPDP